MWCVGAYLGVGTYMGHSVYGTSTTGIMAKDKKFILIQSHSIGYIMNVNICYHTILVLQLGMYM